MKRRTKQQNGRKDLKNTRMRARNLVRFVCVFMFIVGSYSAFAQFDERFLGNLPADSEKSFTIENNENLIFKNRDGEMIGEYDSAANTTDFPSYHAILVTSTNSEKVEAENRSNEGVAVFAVKAPVLLESGLYRPTVDRRLIFLYYQDLGRGATSTTKIQAISGNIYSAERQLNGGFWYYDRESGLLRAHQRQERICITYGQPTALVRGGEKHCQWDIESRDDGKTYAIRSRVHGREVLVSRRNRELTLEQDMRESEQRWEMVRSQ